MTILPRLLAGAALAVTLGAGATMLGGAQAATITRTTCDSNGICTRTTTYDRDYDSDLVARERVYSSAYRDLKPRRYACDIDGDNCHYTRSYYIDEDGNAVYDSSIYPY